MRHLERHAEAVKTERVIIEETITREPVRIATKVPSEESVRLRAYQNWEAAGRPEGDGVEFWLQAERDLKRAND